MKPRVFQLLARVVWCVKPSSWHSGPHPADLLAWFALFLFDFYCTMA
jgi:hypothetical protein